MQKCTIFIVLFIISCLTVAWKSCKRLSYFRQSLSRFNPYEIPHIKQENRKLYSSNHLLSMSLPKERNFEANEIELLRIIGNVNIIMENSDEALSKKEITLSIRLFEAKLWDGSKVFLKEFSPDGMSFGKKERSVVRKLSNKWLEYEASYLASKENTRSTSNKNAKISSIDRSEVDFELDDNDSSDDENGTVRSDMNTKPTESVLRGLRPPFFPTLLGSLTTDERIEDYDFQVNWRKRFPVSRPPAAGNFWIIYQWNDSSFKQLRRFPPLPQIVEGLDYFSKSNRLEKRWRFIRKIMRRCLESLDSLHKSGYCHNTLTSECIWLTTTNQQEIDKLHVVLTELGSCEKISDLGPYAKAASTKDLYNLGLIFLELIVSSFCDDNLGAQKTRAVLAGEEYRVNLLARVEEMDYTQLRMGEWQILYEEKCEGDFQTLRKYVGSVRDWNDAYVKLEADDGLAWRLIFFLLASRRLYDDDRDKPLTVTPSSILKQFRKLFGE